MRDDRLVELRYSGLPNPTRILSTEQAAELWKAIDGLAFAVNAAHPCWNECDDEDSERAWRLSTGTGDTRRGAIIRGQFVFTHDGVRFDSGFTVKSVLQKVTIAAPVLSTVSSMFPSAMKNPPDARRCNHKPGHHESSYPRCACGSPADGNLWRVMDICDASTCYNYAVRDVWCEDEIIPIGATPRAFPSNMSSYDAWAKILGGDGVLRTKPKTAKGGWYIALATSTKDFHFLRLDGQFWTHKFGGFPSQTCDVSGAKIPRKALEKANLCEYGLVGTFYVPKPLRINN
jgi:hypothetical protein